MDVPDHQPDSTSTMPPSTKANATPSTSSNASLMPPTLVTVESSIEAINELIDEMFEDEAPTQSSQPGPETVAEQVLQLKATYLKHRFSIFNAVLVL
jgi:hypothetical protein